MISFISLNDYSVCCIKIIIIGKQDQTVKRSSKSIAVVLARGNTDSPDGSRKVEVNSREMERRGKILGMYWK